MAARPKKRSRKQSRAVAEPPITLLRAAKGTRPEFYEDPAIDQLFAIATALTAEVSVAFDRIDTLEQLLQLNGTLAAEGIESHRPSVHAAEQRARNREELLQRVFAVFESSGPRRAR